MGEVHSQVSLVRTLVRRKPDVSIDAHQRTTVRLRVRDHPRAHLPQPEPKIRDEAQAGLPHGLLEAIAILQKPRTPIVSLDLFQELEQFGSEVGLTHKPPCGRNYREDGKNGRGAL